MQAKVNNIEGNSVRITKLDIDDSSSVIPLREINVRLPQEDQSVSQALRYSEYAIIFTSDDIEDDGSTIILARSMTTEELNEEKERMVQAAKSKTYDTK